MALKVAEWEGCWRFERRVLDADELPRELPHVRADDGYRRSLLEGLVCEGESEVIDAKQLTAAHIGTWVVYEGFGGEREVGKIKSFDAENVWVVYKCDGRWTDYKNFTGQNTSPAQLRFATGGEVADAIK